jgi:peptide/nickel transport system substrate-binding protein
MVETMQVTSPDKDTVVIKVDPSATLRSFTFIIWGTAIVPKESVDQYASMNDGKNSVGTGPYMLTNYTSGSSLTFVKNPKYWQKDAVGPGKGNQLPYLDGVTVLILPDPSTRLTALRTGKLDMYSPLVKDDYDNLKQSSQQIQTVKVLAAGTNGVYMRVDKQDLPFKDIKVRQAMAMAIDYKGIVDKLMQGDGEWPGFPMASIPDFKGVFTPFSELPKDTQDIYSYNPTSAKQLLAEAGYPNGFKTDILVNSTIVERMDEMAVFVDSWSKIGVDVTIKTMENAQYNQVFTSRLYENMAYGIYGSHGIYLGMLNWVGETVYNGTWGLEPKSQVARDAMADAISKGDLARPTRLTRSSPKR